MSNSSRLLAFITYLLIQSIFVSSFPRSGLLSPRQSNCDKLVCPPSLDDVVEGAGNLWNDVLGVGAGVAGWVIDKTTGLLVPQPVESESEKKPNNGNAPVADPMSQPGALDTPQDQCPATSNSNPNDGTGQVSANVQSCGLATLQLVWALNCDYAAENSALEVTLRGMDSEVFAVKSLDCPTQDGVWFWVGTFSPEQIESIKKAAHVVKTVEPDIPVSSDFRSSSTGGSLDPTQFQKDLTAVPLAEEEFSLQKRAGRNDRTVSVVKGANPSLNFLSRAPGKQLSNTQASFTPSYTSIQIFVIEFGVIENHPEIAGLLKVVRDTRILYPNHHAKAPVLREPTSEDDFRGTCIASMIGSKRNGIAKGLRLSRSRRLTVVKIYNHIWSLLAGLIEVCIQIQSDKSLVIGHNVVIIPVGFYLNTLRKWPYPQEALSQVQGLITRMIEWQVVFVVAAGTEPNSETSQQTGVLNSYPALWADRLPIIVVGAVDIFTGDNSPWSFDGPQLTVRGPGQGYCLGQNPVGTSVASAYVGGLVAYFLALPDVGAHLRGQGNVPTAVIEYLRRLSYSRSPSNAAALAVWNGLDASKSKTSYSFWIGDPAQDVEISRAPTS